MIRYPVASTRGFAMIPGVCGYMVSKKGDVLCIKTGKWYIVTPLKNRVVIEPIDQPKKGYRVDDLVARAYIPKYMPGDRIIHLDGNRNNNHYWNLEIEPMFIPGEAWTQVKDYEGFYEISDRGRVRSVHRYHEYTRKGKPVKREIRSKILSPWKGKYSRIYILTKDNESKLYTIKDLMRSSWDEEVLLKWMSKPSSRS